MQKKTLPEKLSSGALQAAHLRRYASSQRFVVLFLGVLQKSCITQSHRDHKVSGQAKAEGIKVHEVLDLVTPRTQRGFQKTTWLVLCRSSLAIFESLRE